MSGTAGTFAAFTLDSIFLQTSDSLMYRAHRTATGEPVLLLVPAMPEEWEEAARFRDRFIARARGVRALHHPGILDIREIGHDQASGMPYIAYEAVEGKDLHELTARGRRVADADLALAGAAVADALDHAHAAGFVHGSLTPSCVIVTPDGGAKLAGFGIEPVPGSRTDMRGHAVGSGSYASPEQIIGGVVDGRSDLFSLGLILFEAVTGQHPFLAAPPRDVRDRIVQDEAPLPSKIRPETPGGYNTVLFKLLQKDPAKRPARGAEVAQSLRALHERLLHAPTPAAAPTAGAAAAHTPAARAARPARGVPQVALAAGAAAVVIAAAVAFLVLRSPEAPPAPVAAAPTASPADVERLAGEVEAALRAEDFRRAERHLAALRQLSPLDERVLDLGKRARDLRSAKADRLYAEGVALARQQKVQEARQRFNAVLEVDPEYVDARDRLDELTEHRAAPGLPGGAPAAGGGAPAVRQRVAPTEAPKRLLHVLFRSPLAKGEVRLSVDHRPLPAIAIDLPPAEGGGVLGSVQRTYEMPHGTHQVLVTLVNERGNILGEQTFVLQFEAGREHRVTVEMASARAVPRFTASALR
jgi:tetratricopeptide (TPR) repeat protein